MKKQNPNDKPKKPEMVPVSCRVNTDMAKKITQLAEDGHRSTSRQVELLIIKGMEQIEAA